MSRYQHVRMSCRSASGDSELTGTPRSRPPRRTPRTHFATACASRDPPERGITKVRAAHRRVAG
eukprot:29828-Rhodomonas_salina.1